ncbi:transposase [Fusobacterium polymorphum]|uniref:transposase n=1 Tax=Fusobacterium nucleatum subsp. polymorphum TaxID=76857 RepID=UPI00117AA0C6
MSKLTRENGKTIFSLAKSFSIHEFKIKYLIVLIKKYEYNILRNGENRYYSKEYSKKLRALAQEREIV